MQMPDVLTTLAPYIGDDAITAIPYARFAGCLPTCNQKAGCQILLPRPKLIEGGQVTVGNNENMGWGHRVDVMQRGDGRILKEDTSGPLTRYYLAKDTVHASLSTA